MAADYAVSLYDPFGVKLADVSNFTRLTYTRVVSDWSTLTLTLPPGFDTSLIRAPDGRIAVYRNGQLDTGTIWLIRDVRYKRDATGNITIEVEADTPLSILREPGRFYNVGQVTGIYEAQTAASIITGLWNLSAGPSGGIYIEAEGSTLRGLNQYISVAALPADATSITYDAGHREILSAMHDVANAATQLGDYTAFDIVASAPDALQFQIFKGQRGVDHRFPGGQNPVIFSGDMGNIGEAMLELNYRDEVTVGVAFGKGSGAYRPLSYKADISRASKSPFGCREIFIETQLGYDPGGNTTNGLRDVARAAVRAGRPYAVMTGKIVSTPQTLYGVHWGWGDYVTVSEFGYTMDARIDAISITVDDTDSGPFEVIDVSFRAETAI